MRKTDEKGFTLIEVLVATFILVVMVLILSKVYHQASVAWSAGFRRADGNMTGRSAVGFMARELMNAVADEEYLDDMDMKNGEPVITFISLTGENSSSERVARKITYEKNGDELIRREAKPAPGAYGTWGTEESWTLVTNVASLYFYTSDGLTHDYGALPEWVRMRLTINRSDDVSGVGAASAGPDRAFGTEDDIGSW